MTHNLWFGVTATIFMWSLSSISVEFLVHGDPQNVIGGGLGDHNVIEY